LTFIFGWILGHQDARFGRIGFTPQLIGRGSTTGSADFSIFWRTWDLVEKNFDGKIDYTNMVYGAAKGMVSSLGDPYTAFLTPEEANQLQDDLSGTVSGIGAEVAVKNGKITVVAPVDNSPAKKAGVMSGDIILKIDDASTEGMDVNTAVSKIRGQAGTKVKLSVQRGSTTKEFEITREKITVKSVSSEIKNNNIGYVKITRFDENTDADLKNTLSDFQSKNIKKIIVDLRDNPGGYLDQSVSVASEFVGNGVIVSEKKDFSGGKPSEYKALSGGLMTGSDVKIILLVNGGSASASEIVAGALKDHNRATLVGEKTFGKGSVQEIEDLAGGAKLRVTIAHWYTPNGKNISKEGIAPDVEVKLTDADFNANRDPQLDKALELLK
jgi:carboxyl-terminal processing protease